MNERQIDWESVPDILTKEQFFRLCHIGRSTAIHLLRSGRVPCKFTGNRRSWCYQIKKEDAREYLEKRGLFPELYAAPKGWYGKGQKLLLDEPPEILSAELRAYYERLLAAEKDVMTSAELAALTGYNTRRINLWCQSGRLPSFKAQGGNRIPKLLLLDFLCSGDFRSTARKSTWHIKTLRDFLAEHGRASAALSEQRKRREEAAE